MSQLSGIYPGPVAGRARGWSHRAEGLGASFGVLPGRAALPPRLGGRWLLGNLPEIYSNPLGFLRMVAEECPRIARFRVGLFDICQVNDPQLIEQVLVRDKESYGKSWDYRQLRDFFGNGLLTSEGGFWTQQRRRTQPAFRHDRIRQYTSVFRRHAKAMVDSWPHRGEVDIHREAAAVAVKIIAEVLFSSDAAGATDTLHEVSAVVNERFESLLTSPAPLPFCVPTPANLRLRRHLRRLKAIVAGFIQQRRQSRDEPDDLLRSLLEARSRPGRISERQLQSEAMTLFFAGHESTAVALAWCFDLIARHPNVAEKLRDEYREVLGDAPPTADDVRGLPYTRAVIQETMRLYPPAWSMGREARRETSLGGYRIPRGTRLLIPQYIVHRDPRYYRNAEQFDPDRWLDGRAGGNPRYAYFPFGAGPRSCVGASLAMTEMAFVLPIVLQNYELEAASSEPVQPRPALTLHPKDRLMLRVHRRERTRDGTAAGVRS